MTQEIITVPAEFLRELLAAANAAFEKHFRPMQQPYRRRELANAAMKNTIGMEQIL